MARGFESKDVEFQQAEAERGRARKPGPTPADRAADERQQAIRLTLSRLRAERAAATNPNHRVMLDQAIRALEEQTPRR